MKKFVIILLNCSFIVSMNTVYSQNKLTIEQAIATTLENNYSILLLKNDSTSFALDNSYAKAAFLPRVNATSNYQFNNNDQSQTFTDGTKRERDDVKSNNINASVQLNWTLFDGLKMFATKEKLAEFVELGSLNIRNQMVNSIATVTANYYNIVRQKQLLKAIEEQMNVNEERVKIAEQKLSVGLGAKPELLQAKVDLNAQKAARMKQLTLIEQLKEQLNQLMNVKLSSTYEVDDEIVFRSNIILAEVMTVAEKSNPALLSIKKKHGYWKTYFKRKKSRFISYTKF